MFHKKYEQTISIPFTKLWTLKEVTYKLLGEGQFDPLLYKITNLDTKELTLNKEKYYYSSKTIENYQLSIVSKNENKIIEISLTYSELYKNKGA